MMNPNRAAVALLAIALLSAAVATSDADPCGAPLGWSPSPHTRPAIASAFASHSLLAWRDDSTARCVLLDEVGALAPGWNAEGLELGAAGEAPSQPQLLVLSDSLVVAAWHRLGAQDKDVSVALLVGSGGSAPSAAELGIALVTELTGDQTVAGLVRLDHAHALVLINASGPGTSPLIRQVSRPGAPISAWPAQGIALDDTLLGTRIVSGCDDEEMGCFVMVLRDSAGQPQLRILHLVADGSLDPGWPSGTVVSRDARMIESRTYLLPDRAGGVYMIGWNEVAMPVGKRFGPDGSLQPGWPEDGRELISTPSGHSVSVAEGPQFVVSSTGSLVCLAQLENLIFQQMGIAAMSHESDGTITPGWPSTGLRYAQGINWSGSPQLGLTSADEIVMTWSENTNPFGMGYVMGVALSPAGAELPGWSGDHIICWTPSGLGYNRFALGTDGAFSQIWLETGGSGGDGAHFARFQLADGVVPTLGTARLLEYSFSNRKLRAAWALDGAPQSELRLLRSLDQEPFYVLPALQWRGGSVVGFEDEFPVGTAEARYVLVGLHDGIHRTVSDTLRASATLPAAQIQIVGQRIQRGDGLVFTIELAAGAATIEFQVFDVAGRRLQRQRFAHAGMGPQSVRLQLERRQPGIYLVEAGLADGESVVTRFVVLP